MSELEKIENTEETIMTENAEAVETTEKTEALPDTQEEKFDVKREILSWIMTIAFALVLAILINHFLIVNANVPTGSMEDTIHPKDRLIGWRLAYISDTPQRGDIIMFRYPVDESEIYIKRVIGLPGETLEIKDAKVYIDGDPEPLDEPYLKEEWVVACDGLRVDIPMGYCFVMGDNRNNSADGRYWAGEAVQAGMAADYDDAVRQKLCFVSEKKILGKAIFRYWPKFKIFHEIEYY